MANDPLTQAITYRGKIFIPPTTNYPLSAVKGVLAGVALLAVTSPTQLRGYFRDDRGRRIGPSYAPVGNIPVADNTQNGGQGNAFVYLLDYLGLSITPQGAVDFYVTYCSGNLYFDNGDYGDSDINVNYVNYPQILTATGVADGYPIQGS